MMPDAQPSCGTRGTPTAAGREDILRQLAPPIRRYLRRYCGDPDIAEDVLQDALLRIDRALSGFDGRARLETWALAIATRAAADHFRAAARQPPSAQWPDSDAAELADDGTLEERLIIDEMHSCVREVIDTLPPDYRAALILRDLEGHSVDAVSLILGCSLATAKIRIHRARQRLRAALGDACAFYHDEMSVLRCDRKS